MDPTWSAIKVTHPKPGKVYQNSDGTLPEPKLRARQGDPHSYEATD